MPDMFFVLQEPRRRWCNKQYVFTLKRWEYSGQPSCKKIRFELSLKDPALKEKWVLSGEGMGWKWGIRVEIQEGNSSQMGQNKSRD